MTFKSYAEEILKTEVSSIVEQHGYILETDFCTMISDKYDISLHTVRVMLRRIYPKMSLIKRRLSNDLKKFYRVDIKGFPIVYLQSD